MTCFLSRNYWSSLDHGLMANILEKAISILVGNLNSGLSFLFTALLNVKSKVEIFSIFVAFLEKLSFNYNLESKSEIQNPLCCLLSAGTPTRGLSIVAARNFQPALEPIIEDT